MIAGDAARKSSASPEKINVALRCPDVEPFKVVPRLRLSVLLPLQDLDQPYPKAQVKDELKKDEVIRIDLFCKEGVRATEIVQAALRSRGQQMLVDSLAQDRIKKKQKSEYVVYTESLTADEIAQLLEQLAGRRRQEGREQEGGERGSSTSSCSPRSARPT